MMKLLWGHELGTRMMCFCIYEMFLLLKLEKLHLSCEFQDLLQSLKRIEFNTIINYK